MTERIAQQERMAIAKHLRAEANGWETRRLGFKLKGWRDEQDTASLVYRVLCNLALDIEKGKHLECPDA